MRRALLGTTCVAVLSTLPVLSRGATPVAVDPVTEWSIAASNAAATAMAPLRTPITLAILHLAMYDAVNAIAGDREPYAVSPRVTNPASPHAAAIEAGSETLSRAVSPSPGEGVCTRQRSG